MNSPARRPGSGLSRRTREDRAYRLVLAGGAAGALAVVTFVLAVIGIVGFAWPFVLVIVALVCGFLFKRATGT